MSLHGKGVRSLCPYERWEHGLVEKGWNRHGKGVGIQKAAERQPSLSMASGRLPGTPSSTREVRGGARAWLTAAAATGTRAEKV